MEKIITPQELIAAANSLRGDPIDQVWDALPLAVLAPLPAIAAVICGLVWPWAWLAAAPAAVLAVAGMRPWFLAERRLRRETEKLANMRETFLRQRGLSA